MKPEPLIRTVSLATAVVGEIEREAPRKSTVVLARKMYGRSIVNACEPNGTPAGTGAVNVRFPSLSLFGLSPGCPKYPGIGTRMPPKVTAATCNMNSGGRPATLMSIRSS